MQARKIFVVGSLNIDLVTRVARLPLAGETVPGGDLMLFPGGKGANQACAAARLGGGAIMIGQLGSGPFGDPLLTSLQTAGVDLAGVGYCATSTGTACISVLPGGENAIVISPGANAMLTPQIALERLASLDQGDLLLLQLEVPLATVEAALAYAESRGALSILDPAPARPLSRELLRKVHYLTPNQSEAALLLDCPGVSIDDFSAAQGAADRLMELGPRAVVLKLGSLGCFVASGASRGRIPGFTVDVVDTTAAGDTFNGAFAVGLAEGMSIPMAAHFANAASALSVTRSGAQTSMPNREEVMAFLQASGRIVGDLETVCS